jgi:hypothetical protein
MLFTANSNDFQSMAFKPMDFQSIVYLVLRFFASPAFFAVRSFAKKDNCKNAGK